MNVLKNRYGPHRREDWRDKDSDTILVAARLDRAKGTAGGDRGDAGKKQKLYHAAKNECDHDAARELVDRFVGDDIIDQLIDHLAPHIAKKRRIILVHPQPRFNGDDTTSEIRPVTNAIPFALSALFSEALDAELNGEIVQTHRPGRTKLKRIQRFLFQPAFSGKIDSSAVYVLTDDAYTLGGTLAMLRSHIVSHGGTIGGVCVLCHSSGKSMRFSIAGGCIDMLSSKYGSELSGFWLKEVGHDVSQLTDAEGVFLSEWERGGSPRSPIDQLRGRFGEARAKGE